MPFYTYKCEVCDRQATERRKVDERNQVLPCNCGHDMRLMITATQIAPVHGGGSRFSKVVNTPPV